MRQIRVESYGGPDVLVVRDAPEPVPESGQAVVAVAAAGVNPTDYAARIGHSPLGPPTLPHTPGWDLAGTVTAIGSGVTDIAVGDAVVGMIPWYEAKFAFGAYAELALVQSDWLVPRPAVLTEIEAATFPLNAVTAVQLLEKLDAPPEATVVVTGASGGLGSFVVQMLKSAGYRVVAQAGTDDENWVRELGADEVHPRDVDFSSLEPVRYMIDCVPLGDLALPALVDAGRVVTVRPTPDPPRGIDRRIHLIHSDRDALRRVIQDGAQGRLRTRVSHVLPLEQAPDAHRLAEAGGLHGKVVLAPGQVQT